MPHRCRVASGKLRTAPTAILGFTQYLIITLMGRNQQRLMFGVNGLTTSFPLRLRFRRFPAQVRMLRTGRQRRVVRCFAFASLLQFFDTGPKLCILSLELCIVSPEFCVLRSVSCILRSVFCALSFQLCILRWQFGKCRLQRVDPSLRKADDCLGFQRLTKYHFFRENPIHGRCFATGTSLVSRTIFKQNIPRGVIGYTSHVCFTYVPGMSHACLTYVSRMSHVCLTYVSRMSHVCLKDVRMSQIRISAVRNES
jgi:hypothetical protein